MGRPSEGVPRATSNWGKKGSGRLEWLHRGELREGKGNMFRVFQRKLGKGSLVALTLLLVALAGTLSAVRPLNVSAASLDTCGYNPAAAPAPGGGTVVFNENTVTRAIKFYGVGLGG